MRLSRPSQPIKKRMPHIIYQIACAAGDHAWIEKLPRRSCRHCGSNDLLVYVNDNGDMDWMSNIAPSHDVDDETNQPASRSASATTSVQLEAPARKLKLLEGVA